MDGIRQWLAAMGLERYAEAFEREKTDPDSARYLTEANVKDWGCRWGSAPDSCQSAALFGHLEAAVQVIEEVLEQIGRPGLDERVVLAEAVWTKGSILELAGDLERAAACSVPRWPSHASKRAKS